jgi:hypothetical protein
MKEVDLSPFILDLGDIKETKPSLCQSVAEIARVNGFRRPESILKRGPSGKKLVQIVAMIDA